MKHTIRRGLAGLLVLSLLTAASIAQDKPATTPATTTAAATAPATPLHPNDFVVHRKDLRSEIARLVDFCAK